jgi:glycerol-3-phosphate acyltransferase PlsY
MTAAASMPVAIQLLDLEPAPLFGYALAMALLIAWAHRGNLARMRAGTEPHLNRLWLLRPRGQAR